MVNSIKNILSRSFSSSKIELPKVGVIELTTEDTEAIIKQFSGLLPKDIGTAEQVQEIETDISADDTVEGVKDKSKAVNDGHIDYFEDSQVELLDLIDSASRSLVYSCLLKRGSKTVDMQIAVKVTQYGGKFDSLHFKLARNEALIMQQISHPNVIQFFEANHIWAPSSNQPLFSYLQVELMAQSLEQVFFDGFFLNESQAGKLLEQISSAVTYLHRQCIAHHDLTPANILLDRPPAKGALNECIYKLADFNQAMMYPNTDSLERMPLGDYRYFAPEKFIYLDGYNPFSADIFSVGLVIIEALTNFCVEHREANMSTNFSKKLTLLNYRGLIGKQMQKVLFQMTDEVPTKRKLIKK